MNSTGIVLLTIAAMAMVIDWWAVRSDRNSVEQFAKPAVMVALIAAASVLEMEPSSLRPWIVLALIGGLVGDVALLPRVDRFIVGLGAFLLGHLAYLVAFGTAWQPGWLVAVAVAAFAALAATIAVPVLRAVRGSGLFVPVLAYVAVSGAVVVFAAATGRWLVFVGALTFAVSDSLLGHGRFVDHDGQHRTLVHITYHSGQALILLGTLT